MGLIGRMPYEVATALYIAAFIVIFEYKRSLSRNRRWRIVGMAVLVAVLTSASVGSLFRYVFLVNLPG